MYSMLFLIVMVIGVVAYQTYIPKLKNIIIPIYFYTQMINMYGTFFTVLLLWPN